MSLLRPDHNVWRIARHVLARFAPVLAILGIVLVVLGIALAWRYTGLSEVATPERIRSFLAAAKGQAWAILVVVPLFVLAGALAFPLNMLILATAAVFGPWLGMLYGGAGAMSSGVVMFFVGRRLGRQTLERRLDGRAKRALEAVRKQGVLAVVALRLLPVAPFTFVNLAAGAGGIRFVDFVLGSVLGLLPGLTLLSVMGDRIISILSNPTIGDIGLVILCVLGLIGLAAGAQALLSRRGGRA
jgi:phospholipase D1/2